MTTTPEDFEAQREAKARAERDRELNLPNFTALREWIDKLEEWCREEAEERQKFDGRVAEMRDKLEDSERALVEARNATAELESLEDQLEDALRGVRSLEEIMEERRRAAQY